MTIPLDQIFNMPAFSPYYPMLPARYRNVQFQLVCFRADLGAVDRVLPSCFEPTGDGFCAALGINVRWAANYGGFMESVLTVKCCFRGQIGYFAPIAFLNSRSSIPAGREIYGTPKVFADIEVGMDERIMFTETKLAGSSVMTIRSTMHKDLDTSDLPNLTPAWRLKVIPKADGTGPDVLQVIDAGRATSDVTIHVCRSGDGVVQFEPSPIYGLSDFSPTEYLGAYYFESDYTEGYAEIIHDFLDKGESKK